jgi:hypothetical protein
MDLTVSEIRIIIDALECKLTHLQQEQNRLDDVQQEKIAELSNDMYVVELLHDTFQDEYNHTLSVLEDRYKSNGLVVQPEEIFHSGKMVTSQEIFGG